ncbi:DUF2779 domain-containing protein [Brevundimonas denitrificans]|nr:DUF2779 domain-containing protein [Brevundimonas denitrificans]
MRPGLSKSQIAAFEQCARRLWLAVHQPDSAVTDDSAQARFDTGREVGAVARSLAPEGVLVDADPDLEAALVATRAWFAAIDRPVFEATFEHEGVLIRIDVLEPMADGGWRVAEVKSSTSTKPHYRADLATQVWVARQAGVPIGSATIRHIDNRFLLTEPGRFEGLLADHECLADIEVLVAERPTVIEAARAVLTGPDPAIAPGDHCVSPHPCPFSDHCNRGLPEPPAWPVTILPNGGGRRWLDVGVHDLLAVPEAALTNPVHRRVYEATLSGVTFHDVDAARAAIGDWAFPRAWLDFETIAFAVPRWIGTRPYQQIPFQFSVHVEQQDGGIEHRAFLSLDGEDPRRACAQALIDAVPEAGAVIAYSASFERSRIRELAVAFPDLAPPLSAMADRLVDLLPATRAAWYHRDQRGSWSIKAVLPTIAPELDYGGLQVKDGEQAQAAWREITGGADEVRRTQLERGLLAYCERDTWAMVVLARRLCAD